MPTSGSYRNGCTVHSAMSTPNKDALKRRWVSIHGRPPGHNGKVEAMRHIVEDLIRVDGVIGSLLVGKDGLVVASTLMDEEDAEILGAMSAAVFGEIDKATKRIGVGTLIDTIIDAEQGSILMLEAKDLILVVITQRMVNLGLVKMEMRRASKRISEAVPI